MCDTDDDVNGKSTCEFGGVGVFSGIKIKTLCAYLVPTTADALTSLSVLCTVWLPYTVSMYLPENKPTV